MNAGDAWLSSCIWLLGGLGVLFLVGRWLILRADNKGRQGWGEYKGQSLRTYPRSTHLRGPSAPFEGATLADQRRHGRHNGPPVFVHVNRRLAAHPDKGGDFDTWNDVKWLDAPLAGNPGSGLTNGTANNVFIVWE